MVLSGGMAKGAYQIGALKAINEVFRPSDMACISAASVGALNAYAFLTESFDKGVRLWNEVCNENNRAWVTTLLRSSFLQNAITTIVSDVPIKNTFYVPLVNLKKRTLSYVDFKKVPPDQIEPYLRASVAMPIYNSGVKINNEHLYDGALIDNIPIRPMLKHSFDYIICIYFDTYNYTFESEYLNNKIIKMNFSDNTIVSNSVCLRKETIGHMIDEGYAKAKRILDYVFFDGTENTDAVYARIADLNAMNTNRNLRITGDVVVNNMNRVTKKLMKRLEII
jgi:predicted acylesterase/phospholipase RssA